MQPWYSFDEAKCRVIEEIEKAGIKLSHIEASEIDKAARELQTCENMERGYPANPLADLP